MRAAPWAMTVASALSLTVGASVASADPPGFPNLDDFTPVNVNDYVRDLGPRNGTHIDFSVPGGQYTCGMLNGVVGAGRTTGLGCRGQLPAVPDDYPLGGLGPRTPESCITTGVGDAGADKPFAFSGNYGNVCGTGAEGARLLPAGHKITMGTVTCAATEDTTACLDTTNGSHGFVLQPSGSWTF